MIEASALISLAFGTCTVAIGPLLRVRAAERPRRLANVAAAVHPLVTLGLFYSLAIHMHARLGGWPRAIGNHGFPTDLVWHAALAEYALGSLLLGCMFALPLAVVVCACVPRLRPGLRSLATYALACGVAIGAMLLAPDPYLTWWRD